MSVIDEARKLGFCNEDDRPIPSENKNLHHDWLFAPGLVGSIWTNDQFPLGFINQPYGSLVGKMRFDTMEHAAAAWILFIDEVVKKEKEDYDNPTQPRA